MSEGHFHVHGPHDHEVEHAAHSGDPLAGRIAMMTAIFATIGALYGYMAGATQNDALLFKNEAAIRTLEASDQWNFYQAKSSKQNLAELGATLTTGEAQARYQGEIERYKKEKEEIMVAAKEARGSRQGGQRAERGVDARPSPLGAGDDADPDRHRARRDHDTDAQQGDRNRRRLRRRRVDCRRRSWQWSTSDAEIAARPRRASRWAPRASSRDCATPARLPTASMHRRSAPRAARSSGASRVRRRAGCVPATTPSIRRAR